MVVGKGRGAGRCTRLVVGEGMRLCVKVMVVKVMAVLALRIMLVCRLALVWVDVMVRVEVGRAVV